MSEKNELWPIGAIDQIKFRTWLQNNEDSLGRLTIALIANAVESGQFSAHSHEGEDLSESLAVEHRMVGELQIQIGELKELLGRAVSSWRLSPWHKLQFNLQSLVGFMITHYKGSLWKIGIRKTLFSSLLEGDGNLPSLVFYWGSLLLVITTPSFPMKNQL